MGLAGAVGLFLSIVFHELCHSLVARRYGLPMKGITLFIFGGVAEMTDEPPSPKAEFNMAIAGPVASVLVAVGSYLLFFGSRAIGLPAAIYGVFQWLGLINLVLVVFNMVPGYPLDGGRVLRSALWAWKGNIRWATRIASRVGAGFGILLVGLGVLSFLTGNFIGGLWWFLIGLFLRTAALRSYEQLVMRQALEHEPIWRLMNDRPVYVEASTTVQQLVDDYFLRQHYSVLPVVENGNLVGCVGVSRVRELDRALWPLRTVRDIIEPCSLGNTVDPDMSAVQAMAMLSKPDASRLMVVRDGKLLGIVALRDLLRFLSMKMELAGESVPQRMRDDLRDAA